MSENIFIKNVDIIGILYDLSNESNEECRNKLISNLPINVKERFFCVDDGNLELSSLRNKQIYIAHLSLQNQLVHSIALELFNDLVPAQRHYLRCQYSLLKKPLDLLKAAADNNQINLINFTSIKYLINWLITKSESQELDKPLKELDLIAIIKDAVTADVEIIMRNIQHFKIQDEPVLIEIAKLCAQQNGAATGFYIQNFKIQDESALIEIAKLCAQQNGAATAYYIQNFKIQDELALIKIAKLCAQQNGVVIAEYIQNFKIQDELALIKIAKLCVQQNGVAIVVYIQNFKIQDESVLTEIAKLCAQQDGGATACHIQNFKIQDESVLIEIAKLCAQQNGRATALNIQNFKIKNKDSLIEIAKLCAQQDGGATADYIQNFEIQDEPEFQLALIEIAKLCAQQNGALTAFYIWKFKIQSKLGLIEIAKLCAQQDGQGTVFCISKFEIQNVQVLKQIQAICVAQSLLAVENIEGFNSVDLIKSVKEENPDQLVQQLEKLILDCFGKGSHFLTLIDTIKTKNSHIQLQMGSWVAQVLFIFQFVVEEKDRQVLINSHLIQSLGKLASPRVRTNLTMELAKLNYNDANLVSLKNIGQPLRSNSKNKQMASPERCAFDFVLYLMQVSGISKNTLIKIQCYFSPLFKASSMLTLIELFYRLHTSPHLKPKDKEIILLTLLDEEKNESKKDKITRVYSLLVILLLGQEAGLIQHTPSEQRNPISSYVDEVFQEKFLLDNKPVDMQALHARFCPNRHPSALFIYAAKLNTLKNPAVMRDLSRYIRSVLDHRFIEERYELKDNIHLGKFAKEYPLILSDWQQALEPITTTLVANPQEVLFDSKSWLIEKLITDKHMSLEKIPNIEALLQDQIIAQDSLSELELSFQELMNTAVREEQKQALEKIEKHLESNQFKQDVIEQIAVLKRTIYAASEKVTVVDSEDYLDLLLAGTEVIGSCQNVNGSAAFNKGLLGYILDGKNRLVAIKNVAGQIIARAKLSLLLDEKNHPVLFLERIYTQNRYEEQCAFLLIDAAQRKATQLNIALTTLKSPQNIEQKTYDEDLVAYESGVSYEYSDAVKGICPNGHYQISKNNIAVLSLPS